MARVGRPQSEITQEKRKEIGFFKEEWEKIIAALPPGAKPSTFIRQAALKAAERESDVEEYDEVPVLGYIAAGPAICVDPAPPGMTVKPPLQLPSDAYGLFVAGDSMTSLNGSSIPDGSIAFFQPVKVPPPGAIVHVEWEVDSDDRCHCTLKKYQPNQVTKTADFVPLNKAHKTITRKFGEFTVRGMFLQYWKK